MGHIMGYMFCLSDDLWMCVPNMDNGLEYYENVVLYVDDCLVMSQHPKETTLM